MRNSIMMISHFEHLVADEGMTWGHEAALRGASERLLPILMTATVTALGVLPLALGSDTPGRELEGPDGHHYSGRPAHFNRTESACSAKPGASLLDDSPW
jgi:multidrug efflux pump subunit AcrB